jgi:hypothetical protein
MNDDPIAKTLDIVPIDKLQPTVPAVQSYDDNQVHDDFEFARGHMINAIEKGQEALSDMIQVAGMSQHPRAYEVIATLVKTVSDASKDMLELQKRKKDLTGVGPTPTTVNNNLFVGSTAELQQLIKKQNEQTK